MMQALISTRSQVKYYNPHDDVVHEMPNLDAEPAVNAMKLGSFKQSALRYITSLKLEYGNNRFILGSVISSTQRTLQENTTNNNVSPLQLLLDMKVCWGSTVAHKTVPMFCGFGQKCLVWSDDIIKGPETYIK